LLTIAVFHHTLGSKSSKEKERKVHQRRMKGRKERRNLQWKQINLEDER